MIEFKITEDVYNKCKTFAVESASSSADKYARRNQFSINKIKTDIHVGKIGEEQTFLNFIGKFPTLTPPDFEIYTSKNKNWDPDLKTSNFSLAVKTQDISSASKFGKSWVFQYGNGGKYDCDTGIFNPDKSKDDHYVSFVSLNLPMRTGKIEAVVSVNWLTNKKMFKEMKKASLRGNKVAVYYEDLIKHKDLWQI